MEHTSFIDQLLAAAASAGVDPAEAYYVAGSSFSARCQDGSVDDYKVSARQAIGFRGMWQGKMGYASTEAFDDEAILQLINGVKESAEVNDSPDIVEIYPGDEVYPEYQEPESNISTITAEEKLKTCLALQQAVLKADDRINRAEHCGVMTSESESLLRNSYGLSLSNHDSYWDAYCGAIAPRGDSVVTGGAYRCGRMYQDLNVDYIASLAAEDTTMQLDAAPVESGEYRVIIEREAMVSLLSTFCGMFSAESAQQNMSLLKGKEGQKIASQLITIIDDPLLPGGYASSPFDAEGCASRTKTVVENGTLKTLLHNRKTARKQGCETTGNAGRAGYASPVNVSPTNFYIKPGEKDLPQLCEDMQDGLVLLSFSGLHAGANPLSGDFSLLCKGYQVKNGKKAGAVEQITAAGNFYRLLENVQAVGSDLYFPGTSIGCPSVDVGKLVISGK